MSRGANVRDMALRELDVVRIASSVHDGERVWPAGVLGAVVGFADRSVLVELVADDGTCGVVDVDSAPVAAASPPGA